MAHKQINLRLNEEEPLRPGGMKLPCWDIYYGDSHIGSVTQHGDVWLEEPYGDQWSGSPDIRVRWPVEALKGAVVAAVAERMEETQT